MAARRRSSKTNDLPPNLYCRNGYYSFRDPRTGKEYGLGRDKRYAVTQAIDANMTIVIKPVRGLVDRINNTEVHNMGEWCEKYIQILERREISSGTMAEYKSRVNAIKNTFFDSHVNSITTKDIAIFLEGYVTSGKEARAKLLRSTLLDMFREAIAEGIVETNPVEATRNARIKIKRSRLSEDEFNAILAATNGCQPWISLSMKLALVTAQRVSDIVKMRWEQIHNERIRVEQKKTGMKLAIPLSTAVGGMTLSDVLGECRSLYASCSTVIATRTGGELDVKSVSRAFAKARDATGINWEGNPPSFHEIRSLAARLYEAGKGEKYAQSILGHKSAEMTERYTDARGSQWLEIE
ncbi:site-specific integrase [Pantoea sp. Fr+CA_20]|uniref:site-specific integrase n=1 Tax=Pantoea sp. Fr+CA_20 TaxID=2929506 RepID=UPI00211773D0|nr:tyrosine-type recombinase/integrase [Pantoea sp. Fr+CA_20]